MTAELDRGLAALKTEFGAEIRAGLITHLGTTSCRRKNNTTDGPWSEHSWPNAVDVMLRSSGGKATAEAKVVGDRIAKWMRDNPSLWSEVFWQIQLHFDHVHGTANPRRNPDNKQVPPCAGGGPIGDDEVEVTKGIQRSLNAAGFNGANAKPLTVDGVWGTNTEHAFTTMAKRAAKASSSSGVSETRVKEIIRASKITI